MAKNNWAIDWFTWEISLNFPQNYSTWAKNDAVPSTATAVAKRTFILAWISFTVTTGFWVRLCLLCWFILLFIQIMASLTVLSTFVMSSSSKWSYFSSYGQIFTNIFMCSWPQQLTNQSLYTCSMYGLSSCGYLSFVCLYNFHILL